MTLLVQEAEDWLESQQPKDDPFDPSLSFEPLDSDAFDTTKDHGDKLAELHDKAREAQESGMDPTDYTTSPTARSFVPYYTQRLSTDCVLNGASAIQKSLKRKTANRHPVPAAA